MECTLYSLTDPDSRWMKDKKGNYGLNYNYQVAIDSKTGMVVAQILNNESNWPQWTSTNVIWNKI